MRPPSCCRVLVRNGACGRERYGFSSTVRTRKSAPSRPSARPLARASSSTTTPGAGLAAGVEVLAARDPRAVHGDEVGRERRRRRGRQLDVPVAGADERDALALALDDEADRRALHAPRRQAAVDPPPEHGGHLVAVEPVEDAAGLGGVDEAVVDAPRVVHGVIDRRRRDLVEHHPLDRHLRLQVLEEVPADGLALAVLVRREVQLGGVLEGRTQVLDHLLAALGELVRRLEPVVHVDGQALRREVGDVAHGGAHVVGVAEELGDGLGLRRRLDDDQWLGHRSLSLRDGRLPCQGIMAAAGANHAAGRAEL